MNTTLLLLAVLAAAAGQGASAGGGRITGRVSPEVEVTIIAKLRGTNADQPENVKAKVTLAKGGAFSLDRLPAGNYDLLFQPQGGSASKVMGCRWSRVIVKEGKTTDGINLRMTPSDADQEVDTVIVGFEDVAEEKAIAIIEGLGGKLKDEPIVLGKRAYYTVDIPDDKSVADMVKLFKAANGVSSAEPNGIARIK